MLKAISSHATNNRLLSTAERLVFAVQRTIAHAVNPAPADERPTMISFFGSFAPSRFSLSDRLKPAAEPIAPAAPSAKRQKTSNLTRAEVIKLLATVPWLDAASESSEKRGRLAGVCFAGLDLSYLNFSQLDLRSADFSGCNLRSCDFQDSACYDANFADADLTDAYFNDAEMNNAAFDRSLLVKTDMTDANCENATFTGATLTEPYLHGTNLPHAKFDGATLTGVVFSGAVLGRNEWAGAKLGGCRTSDCETIGPDRSARPPELPESLIWVAAEPFTTAEPDHQSEPGADPEFALPRAVTLSSGTEYTVVVADDIRGKGGRSIGSRVSADRQITINGRLSAAGRCTALRSAVRRLVAEVWSPVELQPDVADPSVWNVVPPADTACEAKATTSPGFDAFPKIPTATLTIGSDVWTIRPLVKAAGNGFSMILPAEREITFGPDPDYDGFASDMLEAFAISLRDDKLMDFIHPRRTRGEDAP
ncbi:MAG: pentapeptide repeat family protein [Phycisphaerales bacterium]|nr:pentapeptide repeat family protein [Phycisphaerales bacterium]